MYHFDVEMLTIAREQLLELERRRAVHLAELALQRRSPWRERLAVGLIGLATRLAPAPAQATDARLAYLHRA